MKTVLLILFTAVAGGLAIDLNYRALGFSLLGVCVVSLVSFPILVALLDDR